MAEGRYPAGRLPVRYTGMTDARERVTGTVPYTIDVELPRMLRARLLRSSVPHGRIRRLDVSRARAVPGVVAVITGPEIAARDDVRPFFGPVFRDQHILAIDKVRYVGDPVAAVVAHDLDAADEAIALIEVEYEELPAVYDLEQAVAEGAPLVHDEPPRPGNTFADLIVNPAGGTNICNQFRLRKGDVAAGFAEAAHIFEDVFTSPPVQHVPMETHACLADFRPDGLTVWATSQIPFSVRTILSEVFPSLRGRVRVIVPTLGGGYGAKAYPIIEPVTALMSMIVKRPVRLHLSREEEFKTICKHGVRIRLKTGLRADGTIVAREATCLFNTGAYADIGPRLIKNGGYGTAGPYSIPNISIDSYAVYTNMVPAGGFRGYGVSQAAWAYETQMDMIAQRLGIDPYDLRMRNLLVDGQTAMTGEQIHDARFRDLLTTASERIGWDPEERPSTSVEPSKVRGKGLGVIIKGTVTPSTSSASAKLNEDGTLDVLTSSVEMGQGVASIVTAFASEILSLPFDRIIVSKPDTQMTPYDQSTSSSRTTYSMGTAVAMAATEIRRQLIELAAELLEASEDDIELVDGKIGVKGVPERRLDFGEVVRRTRSGNILGTATFRTEGGLDPKTGQGIGSVHWHQAVGAAEVEVDLETGKVEILRYHAGVYAGRVINPAQADLQTEGNVAFGVAQSLFEEMVYDNGQLQNANLGDYMIASIADMPPELDLNLLEDLSQDEVHGIGETTLPPVMVAVGNAVARATGVRITDLPITPERLLRALEEQRQTEREAQVGSPVAVG